MGTPFQTVYDAFLAKIEADDWMETEYLDILRQDWEQILLSAIPHFKYPRVSLDFAENESGYFKEELTQKEIQVLANLMKLEWIRRCVATWDNIRQLYSDKDFSQANFLQKLNSMAKQCELDCTKAIDDYSRSDNFKPNKIFSQLAGK